MQMPGNPDIATIEARMAAIRRRRNPKTVAAYRRLGVEPNVVLVGPKATPFFEDAFASCGGLQFVIGVLRESAQPEARAFMSFYDDPALSGADRTLLPFEAFCAAAGVCPSRMIEVVVAAAAKRHVLKGAIIAALNHPAVMRVNAAEAQKDGEEGFADRALHMKIVGASPMPKSAQTSITVNASASSAAATVLPAAAPAADDSVRRMMEKRHAKQLAAASQPALPAPIADAAFFPDAARESVTIDAEYEGDGD